MRDNIDQVDPDDVTLAEGTLGYNIHVDGEYVGAIEGVPGEYLASMQEEDARGLFRTLRNDLGGGWKADFPGKDVNEYARTVNWTVTLTQRNNLGQTFRFPERVMAIAIERDLHVVVDATDRRVTITLDNDEANELELTEEEKARKQLKRQLRSEFDLNRDAVEALANEYSSVDEIVTASRDELTDIAGIGDRRATEILHRRSDKLKQRIQETTDDRTVPVIEDESGILRLPEEFEDGEYTPKRPGGES